MDPSKKLKTLKVVLLLLGVVVIFVVVSGYYQNLFKQNSNNILSQEFIQQQEQKTNMATNIKEEAGAYVNVRRADIVEDSTAEENMHSSPLEFEIEEKDYTNSTDWVHIIEFE